MDEIEKRGGNPCPNKIRIETHIHIPVLESYHQRLNIEKHSSSSYVLSQMWVLSLRSSYNSMLGVMIMRERKK